jgi:hypothetical protein
MTWSPLRLQGISFISPYKDPALLEFQNGLNVVCGASDTGKSFIAEAINFLLGAKVTEAINPLRPIPQRDGYDRARLVLQAREDEVFTLQRSTSGGNFSKYEGSWLSNEPNVEARVLSAKHGHGNYDTLSTYLLSLIELEEKYVQENQRGDTRGLSFRDLVRLVLIQENEIIKQVSPILSERPNTKTLEYSVFKLLLTGLDASALAEQTQRQNEIEVRQNEIEATRKSNRAKAEMIDELLQELQSSLHEIGINRNQAEAQLLMLENHSARQQEILSQAQRDLNSNNRMNNRRELLTQIDSLANRINEIDGLLSRFELLKEHYRIDLERLASIEESGSLFVHLEWIPCPLCGSLPSEQHQSEVCDGDVASVVNAATAEIAKVERLSAELEHTAEDLRIEAEDLATQQEIAAAVLQELNQEIQEITNPLKNAQNTFSELITQIGEIKRVIEIFDRIEQLRQKKSLLLVDSTEEVNTVRLQVDLSPSVLEDFAKKVQDLLQAWNFPGSDRVSFDEARKDLMIGGQTRTSRGKGLRAITHAAMTIGLMEFCKERNLSHPGFVVLDSPLLAYRQPEDSEDKIILEGVGLKEKFYEYLANNCNDSQILIIENEHPPSDFEERIMAINFTGNPNDGRYGFFPVVES